MYWHKVAALQQIGPYLLGRGIPPARLLRRHGLPASLLLDNETWVTRRTSLRLVLDLCRLADDPWAGLHIAEVLRFEDLGPWGRGILQAPTLGGAIGFAARRIRLIQTGTRISAEVRSGRVHLAARYETPLEADPRQHELANVLVLKRLVDLAGERVPVEATVSLPRSGPADELERLLGPDLRFGRPQLSFDAMALDLPLGQEGRADGALAAGLAASEDPAARTPAARTPANTARAAFAALRETIQVQRPTVAAVAQSLSMSVRTLQRHLEAWGVTFEQMLDEYRRARGLAELTRGRLPITEIAYRLGYSDPAHFTRAVRRWTGATPRQLRQRPEAGAGHGPVAAPRSGPAPATVQVPGGI